MASIKTKERNRMTVNTLRMVAQIKTHLVHEQNFASAQQKRADDRRLENFSEHELMSSYDAFTQMAELEEFEEGVFCNDYAEADAVARTRQDAFMETLFDFDMLQADSGALSRDGKSEHVASDDNWEIDELLSYHSTS